MYAFIASPGDVVDARFRARRAIDRVNRLVAKQSGILLEAVVWENIRPGRADRAQDLINPYVDAAHIFIGILHQRFGAPTGLAESGTEEEFNRVVERWKRENPKPEVWVWFKRPTPERSANPDDQLQHVLDFKGRIRDTTLYKEFDDEDAFQDSLEDALADWVHERAGRRPALMQPPLYGVNERDLSVLLSLLGMTRPAGLPAEAVPSAEERDAALQRLSMAGILAIDQHAVQPDLQTFLFVTGRFLSSARALDYVSTMYYNEMLTRHLPEIVQQRHHATLVGTPLDELTLLLKISPKAVTVVFFGDTTRYDNLFAHVGQDERLRVERQRLALELLTEQALLAAAEDIQHGSTVTHLDGKLLAVKVLGMKIAAAFRDRLAFAVEHRFPIAVVRADTAFREGQMAFGSAEIHADVGLALLHLDEYVLALQSFDQALRGELRDEVRAATLNNRGLARLRLRDYPTAIADFQAALQLNPALQETQANLSEARRQRGD